MDTTEYRQAINFLYFVWHFLSRLSRYLKRPATHSRSSRLNNSIFICQGTATLLEFYLGFVTVCYVIALLCMYVIALYVIAFLNWSKYASLSSVVFLYLSNRFFTYTACGWCNFTPVFPKRIFYYMYLTQNTIY